MPQSRSLFRAFWPLALVLVIAAIWCTYWYIAREKAKQSFATYVEKNQRAGIAIACSEERWAGFPFRFELHCNSLQVVSTKRALPFVFSTAELHAVALAYNPFHLIAEMQGPFSLTTLPGTQDATVISSSGKPMTASIKVKLNPNRADQVSILANDQTGTVTHAGQTDGTPPTPYTLQHFNLHSRFADAPVDGVAPFDFDISLEQLVYGPDRSTLFGKQPLRIDKASTNATITALPYKGGQSFAERARRWQDGGGELTIHALKSVSNFLTGTAKGALKLDTEGRLNGKLEWTVSGFDDLMARLRTAGVIEENAAAAADTLLTLLGKADPKAEIPGLKLKTILKEGKLYFGPFKIAVVPPLF